MVLGQDGVVRAHSEVQQVGHRYEDPVTLAALASMVERVEYTTWNGHRILDVATPIRADDRRLGTVRIGLSLEGLNLALAQSRRYLVGLTLVLVSGPFFTALLARWFTEPLLTWPRSPGNGGEPEARADTTRGRVGASGEGLTDSPKGASRSSANDCPREVAGEGCETSWTSPMGDVRPAARPRRELDGMAS